MAPPVVIEDPVNPMTESPSKHHHHNHHRGDNKSSSAVSDLNDHPPSGGLVKVEESLQPEDSPVDDGGLPIPVINDAELCSQETTLIDDDNKGEKMDDTVTSRQEHNQQEEPQELQYQPRQHQQQQQSKDQTQITDPSPVDQVAAGEGSTKPNDTTMTHDNQEEKHGDQELKQDEEQPTTPQQEKENDDTDPSVGSTGTEASTTVNDNSEVTTSPAEPSSPPRSEVPPVESTKSETDPNDTVVKVVEGGLPPPPGTSTKSLPANRSHDEQDSGDNLVKENDQPNVELQRSRSETDASSPTVDAAAAAAAEELTSDLQEFLSSPTGNSQIVERSPGGRYVRFIEKLGSGASKDVYKAYDTQEGIEVAWNVVHLAGVPKQERNRIVNEVRLLERLHHQNIISFHGSWVNRERQQVNFVTEILSSGTLKSFINRVQVIRWKIAKRWAVQILKGLEYLHSQDPPVIHRDLKCENIFINGTSGDLRIGDLGLSTVHRNGKVLSVLGTPEFMAPDMYDETPYDVKVDIYAFGMCLLEIFTKEIPYRECNNPAQIYKKVMRGAPPDSLMRLRSKHAKEFIELCLGYRDEDGKYVRPSATELLEHPFLIKRPVDDDEVEVDPPLREQPIGEGGESNEYARTEGVTDTSLIVVPGKGSSPKAPRIPSHGRQNSLEIDDKDGFDQMPDSEINSIRKVKVMMGRGEELKEEDDVVHDNESRVEKGASGKEKAASEDEKQSDLKATSSAKPEGPNEKTLHYLVAAAVLEGDEQTSGQPYPDDVLKLVVTLPVDGQTQNVQFDFHLVEDDPIQVAKEMVEELEIPNGAVLEVSETISGLARTARTKKHKYQTSQQQQQQQQQGQPTSTPGHVRGPSSLGTSSLDSIQNSASQQHSQQQQQQHSQPIGQTSLPPPPPPQPQHQMQQNVIPGQQTHQPQQQMGQNTIPSVPPHQHPQQFSQAPMPPPHQPQHMSHAMSQHSMQDYMPSSQHQQQMSQQHTQGLSHPSHGMPLQDQGGQAQGQSQQPVMQGSGQSQQHISQSHYAQTNAQIGTQHGPGASVHGQHQNLPQQQPQQPLHQQQHIQQINGEYHQHVQSDKFAQAPAPYSNGQMPGPLPLNLPPRTTSNTNIPQQNAPPIQQQQQQQLIQHDGTQNSYQTTPQSHQSQLHVQAPSPADQNQLYAPTSGDSRNQGQVMQHSGHLQQQQFQSGQQQVAPTYSQQNFGLQQQTALPLQQPQAFNGQKVQQQQQQQQQQSVQPPHMTHQQHQHIGHPSQQHQLPQQHQQIATQQQPHVPAHFSHHTQQQLPPQQHGQQSVFATSAPQTQHVATASATAGFPSAVDTSVGDRAPTMNTGHTSGQPLIRRDSEVSKNRLGQPGLSGLEEQTQRSRENLLGDGGNGQSSDDESDDGDYFEKQLRQVDEDYHKNVSRTKKVFDSRMENLQRTQTQRESQQDKTEEQHQKERAAFEKRLQQEEIDQNRRIEQMQKDWERRREEVIQQQHASINTATDSSSEVNFHASGNTSSTSMNGPDTIPPALSNARVGSGSTSDVER